MSILSSVFSILAPQRPVNYDSMWRVIDSMQNRAEKRRDEELAARANVNDIAAKFGAKITGLPNDARATRQKFEELFVDFKYDFEKFSSSGFASSYTGSIVSLNHISKLQQIETDVYLNSKRESEYNLARELVTKSGNTITVPFSAIADMAINTSTILKKDNVLDKNIDDLTFSGIFEMYARDDNYAGTDMNSLIESSRIDPKEAINYFSQLLGLVGNMSYDNYEKVLNKLDQINNSSSGIPDAQKIKTKDFLIKQGQTNKANLQALQNAINDGTLMTQDMAMSIKTGILNDLIIKDYPDMTGTINPQKAKELYNKTEGLYKVNLADKIADLAKIALIVNENNKLPDNLNGGGDQKEQQKITLTKQYVSTHNSSGQPAILNYDDNNFGWNVIDIKKSNTVMPLDLSKEIIGTAASEPMFFLRTYDANGKLINNDMYNYDENNIDYNYQYYSKGDDDLIKEMYGTSIAPPGSINLTISNLYNRAFSFANSIFTETSSTVSKEELEQLFFYGLTKYEIDKKDDANSGVIEFQNNYRIADFNNKIDFITTMYQNAINKLYQSNKITDIDKQDAFNGILTPKGYAALSAIDRKKYHEQQLKVLQLYSVKTAEPVAYSIYMNKGGEKLTIEDIAKSLGATKDKNGDYKLTYNSNIMQNLGNAELTKEDPNRTLLNFNR